MRRSPSWAGRLHKWPPQGRGIPSAPWGLVSPVLARARRKVRCADDSPARAAKSCGSAPSTSSSFSRSICHDLPATPHFSSQSRIELSERLTFAIVTPRFRKAFSRFSSVTVSPAVSMSRAHWTTFMPFRCSRMWRGQKAIHVVGLGGVLQQIVAQRRKLSCVVDDAIGLKAKAAIHRQRLLILVRLCRVAFPVRSEVLGPDCGRSLADRPHV